MPKHILFINKAQFGYHTDYYKFCEYLKDEYKVTYFCFDSDRTKLNMEGVEVKYIPFRGSKVFRGFRFMFFAIIAILKTRGLVFIHYFPGCQILKIIFPFQKMILDIRTLSINQNSKKRTQYDIKLKQATKYFDFVTIISEGLRKKLELNRDYSSIIPLGADVISEKNKDFSQLKLLYVGTLNGRNMSQTVEGIYLFLKKNPVCNTISYDIIGDGDEFEQLKNQIQQLKLTEVITLHGRIPHFELQPFFDACNVGIAYVPITDYYDDQPSTKTYEYIMSGMVCIATGTYENRIIINKYNGVICNDNPESFAEALETIYRRRENYKSTVIRDTLKSHTWKNIVKTKLIPVIENISR